MATEQDVLAFFAKHDIVERISDDPCAVRFAPPAVKQRFGLLRLPIKSLARNGIALRTGVPAADKPGRAGRAGKILS